MKVLGIIASIVVMLGLSGCAIGPLAGGSSATPTPRPPSSGGGGAATFAGTAPLPSAVPAQSQPQCTGYKTYSVPNAPLLDKHRTYKAIIVTNKGTVTVTLLPQVAPTTVRSFIFLAEHHFFDGVKFHRVIPGFMIQGGDPTGTGMCGPGYQFNNEPVTHPYNRGIVAMANAGPNTNGSQFFIMLANYPLQPNYTIFGKVTSGMSAVDAIAKVPLGVSASGERSVPQQRVYIESVRIVSS